MGMGAGLRQGLHSRDASPSNYKRPIFNNKIVGQNEKAIHIGEEYELSEDLAQKHGCDHTNRYDDNLYAQSPPIPFSVFGRPLLPGGFSGLGGMFKDKDLEPLKVVAADGREWGWEHYGALTIRGEESGEVGQREEEAQNESSKTGTYENWESSCLAKFSEVLGIPTKGFEKEILELLQNLVASQKTGKGKGNSTV